MDFQEAVKAQLVKKLYKLKAIESGTIKGLYILYKGNCYQLARIVHIKEMQFGVNEYELELCALHSTHKTFFIKRGFTKEQFNKVLKTLPEIEQNYPEYLV